jgi:hypothetical protein
VNLILISQKIGSANNEAMCLVVLELVAILIHHVCLVGMEVGSRAVGIILNGKEDMNGVKRGMRIYYIQIMSVKGVGTRLLLCIIFDRLLVVGI